MIYSFQRSDPRGKEFRGVLEAHRIDYESVEYDRTVIRIFGSVSPAVREALETIHGGRMQAPGESPSAPGARNDLFSKGGPHVIAGPCSVESDEQIDAVAALLAETGVRYIRGGAYKPRTSPDSFQGMGREGLRLIADAARRHGLKVVSEVMDRSQIDALVEHADVIQVGSRNMFNYTLLTALGAIDRPILLKRGMSATIDEWLSASEYIARGGNDAIILCERGIRTFEPKTRNTLDIAAICLARKLSGYPVIADPSHAAGSAELVPPLALAALAAGADGIMVEIHPEPEAALSDRSQALSFDRFRRLLQEIRCARPDTDPVSREE